MRLIIWLTSDICSAGISLTPFYVRAHRQLSAFWIEVAEYIRSLQKAMRGIQYKNGGTLLSCQESSALQALKSKPKWLA